MRISPQAYGKPPSTRASTPPTCKVADPVNSQPTNPLESHLPSTSQLPGHEATGEGLSREGPLGTHVPPPQPSNPLESNCLQKVNSPSIVNFLSMVNPLSIVNSLSDVNTLGIRLLRAFSNSFSGPLHTQVHPPYLQSCRPCQKSNPTSQVANPSKS